MYNVVVCLLESHGEGVVKGREGGDSVNAQDHDTAIKVRKLRLA